MTTPRRLGGPSATFAIFWALVVPLQAAAITPAEDLRARAAHHESQLEWDKALAIYEGLLRDGRNQELLDRYHRCLRRFWQCLRHQDLSFRKEVLALDYGQALRLYNKIRDTLLDHSLDRKKVDAACLFQQGLDELDAALANPGFCQTYLAGKQAEVAAFRSYLKKKWGQLQRLSRPQAEKQVREVALAAQDMLQLETTVTILELACGACYAFDDYTAYLTPGQFRQLCDALKGESDSLVLVSSVIADMKSESIGYVRVTHFQDTTLNDLDNALKSLAMSGVQGIVLDLRGNPGGLLEVAVDSAKRFLSAGVIVGVENQDPKLNMVYRACEPALCDLPLVVLVDGDTASAAEVLAGALKENERALLIGQTTFGKGWSQALVKLPAASGVPAGGLRITVARFFSPRGLGYTGRGIVPDIVAERFKPETPDVDNQLTEAILDLERQLAMRQ